MRLDTEAEIKRFTLRYTLYRASRSAAFDRGLLAIFFLSHGVSESEAGVLMTVLFFATMAFELPTGAFGDRYGRRLSVIVGLLCIAAYTLGMSQGYGFWVFAPLLVLLALGRSFISGSDNAYVFDALKANGEEWIFMKVESRARAAGGAALALSIICGGLMAEYSWSLLYVVYCVVTIGSLLAWQWLAPAESGAGEGKVKQAADSQGEAPEGQLKVLMRFLREGKRGRGFLAIVAGFGILAIAAGPFFFFAQPTLKSLGMQTSQIGLFVGTVEFLGSFLVLQATRVERRFTFTTVLVLFATTIAICMAVASQQTLWALLIAMAVIMLASPLFDTVALHAMHRKAPSAVRASVMSSASFLLTLCASIGFWWYGLAIDYWGHATTMTIAAFIPAFAVAAYFLAGGHRRPRGSLKAGWQQTTDKAGESCP